MIKLTDRSGDRLTLMTRQEALAGGWTEQDPNFEDCAYVLEILEGGHANADYPEGGWSQVMYLTNGDAVDLVHALGGIMLAEAADIAHNEGAGMDGSYVDGCTGVGMVFERMVSER